MIAGQLVRYVDQNNQEHYGLLMNDATSQQTADIVPLEGILGLGSLILGPVLVGALLSNRKAGGPPYWVVENGE